MCKSACVREVEMDHSLADRDLNVSPVIESQVRPPCTELILDDPAYSQNTAVTSNADRSQKDGSGQPVSPVIPSCAYPTLPGSLTFHGGMGGCRLFFFFSFFFIFSFFSKFFFLFFSNLNYFSFFFLLFWPTFF